MPKKISTGIVVVVLFSTSAQVVTKAGGGEVSEIESAVMSATDFQNSADTPIGLLERANRLVGAAIRCKEMDRWGNAQGLCRRAVVLLERAEVAASPTDATVRAAIYELRGDISYEFLSTSEEAMIYYRKAKLLGSKSATAKIRE